MADTRKYWKILLPAASSDGITMVPTSFPHRIFHCIQKYPEEHMLETLTGAFPQTMSWLNLAQTLSHEFREPCLVLYQAMTRKLCTWILPAVDTHLKCT